MNVLIILLIAIALILFLFWQPNFRAFWGNRKKDLPLPEKCKKILTEKVAFYNALSEEEQERFEDEIQDFLEDCKITGVDTTVTTTDRMLIAASAIIPVFAFQEWEYTNLNEVLLYPKSFNYDYETDGADTKILGMVGNRHLEDTMVLSKQALHHGFANDKDKRNTAIHEFVHLIDKLDGTIDGIPRVLLERPYVLPWINLMEQKIKAIRNNNSDIDPYGGTQPAEFYAVISEYFFERPQLLKSRHPELYRLLEKIFRHKMAGRNLRKRKRMTIGRNDPCPCRSGLKYKRCCGRGN